MIKIKLSAARKFVAFLANFSLLLNSFVPFLLAAAPAYAQEAVPVEVVVVDPTPAPVEPAVEQPAPEPIPIIEITPPLEVTPTPVVSPEPENVNIGVLDPLLDISPTPEITPEPSATPEPSLSPEVSPEQPANSADNNGSQEPSSTPENNPQPTLTTPEPTQSPVLGVSSVPSFEKICLTDEQIRNTSTDEWIINDTTNTSETTQKVQLGVRYIYPQDSQVSVIFKCLPKDESLRTPLKIQKIKTSELNIPDTSGMGEYAYDITTGMTDGTFTYDLTLPKSENSTAKITYIEKTIDQAKYDLQYSDLKFIDNNLEQQSNSVKATSIDHFTIFITTHDKKDPDPQVVASTILAPIISLTPCFNDSDGANDEPGQKDLNQLCQNQGSVDPIQITWTWDETSMNGNNTADACALFDTNSNGLANYAICVTWEKDQQQISTSPSRYSCADTKADRCAGSVLMTPPTGTTCTIGSATNPFNSSDPDTGVYCSIPLSDVGGADKASPLDVCSYPSEQPNSDPSDCILVSSDKGNLSITKNVVPDDNNTNWAITVTGNTSFNDTLVGDDTTGIHAVSPGTYTITEASGNAYTDLSKYNSTWICNTDGTSTSGSGTSTSVNVAKGSIVSCTFTNTLKAGHIVVDKKTNPSGDPQSFAFTTTGSGYNTFSLTDSATPNDQTLMAGNYSVSETAITGWDQTSATCISSIGDSEKIGSLELDPGETITCTFTNSKLSINVEKTASPTSVPETGGDVEYTIKVNNPSAVSVNLTSLNDDKFGDLDGKGTCDVPQTIIAGGNYQCKFTETLSGEAGNTHKNIVTATASGITATDDATVTFTDVAPTIKVTKTANDTLIPETGQNVTFTFKVENTGSENISLTKLVDNKFGDLDGKGTCDVPQTIIVGGSYSCTYTVYLSSDSLIDHKNTVTATAYDNDNTKVEASADETVKFEDIKPDIYVTKDANPTSVPETGGNVQFTYVVTNNGPETVTLTSLTDDVFGNLNGQGTCVTGGSILVGKSYSCTLTKFLSSDSLTAHKNLLTAVATDNDGSTDTATDDATVTFTDVAPTIKVTKTADDTLIPETGQNVTFTFKIENTGQEDVTLSDLSDSVFGNLNSQGDCTIPQTILIGNSYTCKVTKFLSSDNLQDHYNLATATANDDDGTKVQATDDETVKFEDVLPSTSVTKDADVTYLPETGKDVKFTFVVYNNNDESATISALYDDKFGILVGDADCKVGTILAGKSSCSFDATFAVPAGTAGTDHKNIFSATLTDNDGNSDTKTDDAVVIYIGAKISFTQLEATNDINDPHTFTITVKENDGDGWINASGELVTFTLVNNTAGAAFVGGVDTCTTNVSGQCTVQINSSTPGSVEIHASVDANVLNYTLHRETDGTLGSSQNATKTYQAGKIIIEKQTLPDGHAQSFEFNPSYSAVNFNLTDGQQNNSGWLAPGNYSIEELVPTGWKLTDITCVDPTQNSGASAAAANLANITLESGETVTCTFTNTKIPTLTVTKYIVPDTDQGLFNLFIDGNGVAINVGNSHTSNPLQVDIGYNHAVTETAGTNTNLNDYTAVYGGDCDSTGHIVLAAGEDKNCTITNTRKTLPLYVNKFEDHNTNGIKDAQDNSLDGWTIQLYDNETCTGDPLVSDVTDSASFPGTAKFENLYQGKTYWVKEVEQANWLNTTGNCRAVTIHDDLHSNNDLAFGNFHYGQLSGYKFEDLNGNHVFDIGETYLKDWEIRLYADNNDGGWTLIGNTITNSSGQYTFSNNLGLNNYKVCEVLKTDWIQSYPIDTSGGALDEAVNCHFFTVDASGQTFTKDFGNFQKNQVTVYKFHDLNGNGTREENEPFLSDWEMTMTPDGQSESVKQLTDANGNTLFKLDPGKYVLGETIKDGWYQSGIYCEDNGPGVLITKQGEAYGHHGWCEGWNGCGDAATCALWACEANGYTNLVSYGDQKPCTQFNNCHLFSGRGNVDWNWGNGCDVMGVTDIKCSNGSNSLPTPTPGVARISSPVSGNNITLNPSQSKTCYIGNYQKATVTVTKDVLGNEGQPIEDNHSFTASVTGQENGSFSENTPAVYYLNPGTYTVSEINIDTMYKLKSDNDVVITVTSGESKTVNFINWKVPAKLTISKTNNRWPTDVSSGSEVEYTITLNVQDNDIKDVTVTDLPPFNFKYKAGSWKVLVGGNPITIPEPVYSSPGKWYLGDLAKGAVVTLSYLAIIDGSVDAGTYKDAAWAYGCQESTNCTLQSGDKLLASAVAPGNLNSPFFVGTQVKIAATTNGQEVNLVKEEGQVLGATTELPGTGAKTIWMIIFSILSSLGLGLIILGLKKEKPIMKSLIIAFLIGLYAILPLKAYAAQSDNIFIRLENPISPTNKDKFTLSFTALDILQRELTVKCYKVNPDSSENLIGTVALKAGGNSGECNLDNNPLTESNKTYYFYAIASADGENYRSDSVAADFNINGPGTPSDYSKEKEGTCRYKLSFRASNDGKTTKIQIYRSENTKFTADNNSKVGEVGISPDQKGTFTDVNVPDCNKTYYYVVRAFDDYNNGSSLAGDFVTTYITTTNPTTVNQGAIPVSGSNIAQEEGGTSGQEEGATGQEGTSVQEGAGSVLGTETPATPGFFARILSIVGRHKLSATLTALILLVIIIYGFKSSRKKRK